MVLKEIKFQGCKVSSSDLGQGPQAAFHESGHELSSFILEGKFLDQFCNC
jgi:hypothetical protein